MKYTHKILEDKRIEITITLDEKEWEDAVEAAYEKNKGKYSIQGFRKGHVPRKVLEKTYGEGVFYEDAIDGCFYRYYLEVLQKESSIKPVDAPSLSIEKIGKDGLTIVATVYNKPEVTLGAYTGLDVKKSPVKVTKEQVDDRIHEFVESRARYVEVSDRPVQMGDMTTIDFEGSVDGVKFEGGSSKDYDLEIGSHSFIDTFEDQIVGMNIGDKRDIKVTFPEEYPAENLKGKPAVFEVTLKAIKAKVLPELNDEFVAEASEFNTVEELRADYEKKLTNEAEHEAEHEFENKLIEKAVDNATVDIPQIMVDQQADDYIREFEYRLSYQGLKLDDYLKYANTTIDELKASRMEDAKKTVKTRLVLEAIVNKENISVEDKDIEDKFNEHRKGNEKKIEDIKKELGNEQLAYMENGILVNKLLKFLKENNNK